MISVTVLTKNSSDTIKATLESLKRFSEVIIYDTGSTDITLDIAANYPNVKIIHETFAGFGPSHNHASSLASNDWILSIDSDEIVTQELADEIFKLNLDPNTVYGFERHNYFNGRHIRWCAGWHPDWIIRMYHRQKTSFSNDAVHEKILCPNLNVMMLKNPVLHTPYRSIGDFLAKMQMYSELFAAKEERKVQSSFSKAIFHGWHAFFKSYILKKGIFGGKEGFIISLYNGHTAYYKYLKLAEKQAKI